MFRWSLLLSLIVIVTACTSSDDDPPLPTRAVFPEDAVVLEFWEAQRSTLTTADPTDEWQFFGRAGDNITLRTITNNRITPIMTVRLRNNIIATGESLDITLPEDEIYRVQVQLAEGTSGEYEIGLGYADQSEPQITNTPLPQVVGVPTPTPSYADLGTYIQQLTDTTEIGGLLTAESPQQVYTYAGTAGDTLSLGLRRVGGTIDPLIMFYAPDGTLIAMDDNSGTQQDARLTNITLPDDGLYSVQVGGKGFFGDYVLTFNLGAIELQPDVVPTIQATRVAPYVSATIAAAESDTQLEDHAPIIGTIARVGGFQRFSFTGTLGDTVTLQVAPFQDSSLRPSIEVYNPDGGLLQPRSQTTNNGIVTYGGISLAQNGTYTILVTGADNTTGDFTLAYGRGGSVQDIVKGDAAPDQQITSTLQGGVRDVWFMPLNAGDVISVAVSPATQGLDPVVEVADAQGNALFRDDDSGANDAALIRIANIIEPATYVLRVYDANGTGAGEYTLLWRYVGRAPTPTPAPLSTALMSIDDAVAESTYGFYSFQGMAGQRVQVVVEADDTESLDPVAALLDPSGAVIAEADDSNNTLNPTFELTLPDDGTYTVRVNGYLSGGGFRLVVRLLL